MSAELPHILIVKAGTTLLEVATQHGDYDTWFGHILCDVPAKVSVVAAFAGETLPDLGDVDAIILTGSPLSVRDEAPWMAELAQWTLAALATVPVLAVCFGHQLLGEALGGRIEQNPAGREDGAILTPLTDFGREDPLFSGLPDTITVQSIHSDSLVLPPTAPGIEQLCATENTPWQAFAWGPRLRALQFHPELPAAALAHLLDAHSLSGLQQETPHGPRILLNWFRHYVQPSARAKR